MKSRSITFSLCRFLAAITCGYASFSSHAELLLDAHLTAQPDKTWQAKTGTASGVTGMTAPLTLAELTELALHNNPATREIWAAARAQAAAADVAGSAYWPTLDANVSLSRGISSINTSSGVVSGNTQTRLSPSISLSYLLFDFGARAATEQSARYGSLAANLNKDRVLQDVVLKVEQAYYQLLAARQTVVAAEETLKTVQMSLTLANSRRQAGLATIGDVYQAETMLAQGHLQLRKAQGEAGKLKGVLCNSVGLPVTAKLEFAALAGRPPVREIRRSIDAYLEQARSARPDLAAAEAQARAAYADIDAAAAQGRPALTLVANAANTYNNFPDYRFDNASNSGSIGINLSVPLFDGFRTRDNVRQTRARAEQLDAARDRIASQIELDVWQAYFDLDTAEAAIDSADALLRSAVRSRQVAESRYQSGVGNLPDLLSVQASEASARMEVISAEMAWYANLSRLNNAIGIFSSETGTK